MKRALAAAAGLAALLVFPGHAAGAAGQETASGPWSDPEFQRRFAASYAAAGEHEPRVSVEERAALEGIIPLMGTDLAQAAASLAPLATPEASAAIDFTLGNIHYQLERIDEAIASYQAALAKFPDFRRAHKNLALASVRAGRMPEAVGAFTRLIELGGADAYSYGLLGHAYAAQEQFLAAESAYRQASLLHPVSLEWKLGIVRCLLRQQKHGEAAGLLDALLHEHPGRADFWLLQANAYLGMKQPMDAARNHEILARLGKGTPETMETLAGIYLNESLADPAARAYARAMEMDPGSAAERGVRGAEALAARGAVEQASALLAAARAAGGEAMDPALLRSALRLQARLSAAEGGGAEAARILEEIVALDPLDGEALMQLADLRARGGDVDRALFLYERAESLPRHESDAKLRRAQLLVRQSRFQDAVPLLRRVQELTPRDDVARYLEQVERIARGRP
ncbi:MAG TPA: tetratricopeptide repeat protein [Candidatus Polarisedimenticolia bacterium]|nr:tetratricopeptide repeat protein [Candidatus Polarisedimenticolia bacterium]